MAKFIKKITRRREENFISFHKLFWIEVDQTGNTLLDVYPKRNLLSVYRGSFFFWHVIKFLRTVYTYILIISSEREKYIYRYFQMLPAKWKLVVLEQRFFLDSRCKHYWFPLIITANNFFSFPSKCHAMPISILKCPKAAVCLLVAAISRTIVST